MEEVLRRTGAIHFTDQGITTLAVDIVVNSANPFLGGIGPELPEGVGGVDGAIHRAAGIELLERCLEFPLAYSAAVGDHVRCEPGELKVTGGYRLPCRFVFHAVAPRFVDGTRGEWETLRSLYGRIFDEQARMGLRSIALVPIGTRAYGIPGPAAARIAVDAACRAIEREVDVVFSLVSLEDRSLYADALSRQDAPW